MFTKKPKHHLLPTSDDLENFVLLGNGETFFQDGRDSEILFCVNWIGILVCVERIEDSGINRNNK